MDAPTQCCRSAPYASYAIIIDLACETCHWSTRVKPAAYYVRAANTIPGIGASSVFLCEECFTQFQQMQFRRIALQEEDL